MPKPIIVKIDVTKIDKTKLFKGKKGTYLDIVLLPSQNDQYGNDYMVVQGVSQQDREAGVRGEILGNGKFTGRGSAKAEEKPAPVEKPLTEDEDVPF